MMSRHGCSTGIVDECSLLVRSPSTHSRCTTTRRATPKSCGLEIAPKPWSHFLPVNVFFCVLSSKQSPSWDAPHPKSSVWQSRDAEMQWHWTNQERACSPAAGCCNVIHLHLTDSDLNDRVTQRKAMAIIHINDGPRKPPALYVQDNRFHTALLQAQ